VELVPTKTTKSTARTHLEKEMEKKNNFRFLEKRLIAEFQNKKKTQTF
jgi:hypothetical protein